MPSDPPSGMTGLDALTIVFVEIHCRLLAVDMDQLLRITTMEEGLSAGVAPIFMERIFPAFAAAPWSADDPECGGPSTASGQYPLRRPPRHILWIQGSDDPVQGIPADRVVDMSTVAIGRIGAMPSLIRRALAPTPYRGFFWGAVTREERIALLMDVCRIAKRGRISGGDAEPRAYCREYRDAGTQEGKNEKYLEKNE